MSTNLDGLVVLTVLFVAAGASGRPRRWQVWCGQYVGFGVLVGLSALAAAGLRVVPTDYVGLLGLVPLGLGVRGIVGNLRGRDTAVDGRIGVAGGLGSVIAITVANGGDNVAVYTALFREIGGPASLVVVAVFVALVAIWCGVAQWLSAHRRVVPRIERYGHWIVPVVFIVVGVIVLVRSGLI